MAVKTVFSCQSCGHQSPKWMGRCPECQAWNSLVEERMVEEKGHAAGRARARESVGGPLPGTAVGPLPLSHVAVQTGQRISTSFPEVDRVFGGGLVKGSAVLIGGEPGIGKSTLLLQVANHLAVAGHTVLYVSGEESAAQIKLRAERLDRLSDRLLVLAETNLDLIREAVGQVKPMLLIVDSIQTVYEPALGSAPGSLSQVRDCTVSLVDVAKRRDVTIVVVGHVTKDGTIAGPRSLEHMVDVVVYLEGERDHSVRVLRSYKNRFGATNEVAVMEMQGQGFVEVSNPSEFFLTERPVGVPGSVVVAAMEGTRPFLVEAQALTSPSYFGTPQRKATGVDVNRLALLVAVLDKRAGLHVGGMDIFVNVAGGLRLTEPAADLGLAMAIASSFKDRPMDARIVVMGEVGLGGEVRAVTQLDRRVVETAKLGFTGAVVPSARLKLTPPGSFVLIPVHTVEEAIGKCLS